MSEIQWLVVLPKELFDKMKALVLEVIEFTGGNHLEAQIIMRQIDQPSSYQIVEVPNHENCPLVHSEARGEDLSTSE